MAGVGRHPLQLRLGDSNPAWLSPAVAPHSLLYKMCVFRQGEGALTYAGTKRSPTVYGPHHTGKESLDIMPTRLLAWYISAILGIYQRSWGLAGD